MRRDTIAGELSRVSPREALRGFFGVEALHGC